MSDPEPKLASRFNWPTKIGFFVAIGSAVIWIGGRLIQSIEPILPWTLGAGVLAMGVGIYLDQQKKNLGN